MVEGGSVHMAGDEIHGGEGVEAHIEAARHCKSLAKVVLLFKGISPSVEEAVSAPIRALKQGQVRRSQLSASLLRTSELYAYPKQVRPQRGAVHSRPADAGIERRFTVTCVPLLQLGFSWDLRTCLWNKPTSCFARSH